MIDQISVRNHCQGFTLSHVAQTNGTGKQHCECPYPVLVGKVLSGEEIGILVTESSFAAEQCIVFPLEFHLHALRGGNDGGTLQKAQILVAPGEGGVDLVDLWQNINVRFPP